MQNTFCFSSPITALEPDVKPETYLPPYVSSCTLAFVALIRHCTRIHTKLTKNTCVVLSSALFLAHLVGLTQPQVTHWPA